MHNYFFLIETTDILYSPDIISAHVLFLCELPHVWAKKKRKKEKKSEAALNFHRWSRAAEEVWMGLLTIVMAGTSKPTGKYTMVIQIDSYACVCKPEIMQNAIVTKYAIIADDLIICGIFICLLRAVNYNQILQMGKACDWSASSSLECCLIISSLNFHWCNYAWGTDLVIGSGSFLLWRVFLMSKLVFPYVL